MRRTATNGSESRVLQALALVLEYGLRWDRASSALVRSTSRGWCQLHDRLLPCLKLGGWEVGRAAALTSRFPRICNLMIERRHGEREQPPTYLFFAPAEATSPPPPPTFSPLQDSCVEAMASLNLTTLHLECESVSNNAVRALGSQRRLQQLCLGSEHRPLTRVTDQGIKTMLSGTTALQMLSLCAAKLTDKAMLGLVSLPHLGTLSLHHVKLTDLGVKAIAALPCLAELHLQNCGAKLTDDAARALAACKTLRQVRGLIN